MVRTELKRNASVVNGSKSKGPVSIEGKVSSSTNSVQHGLASRSVLLPSETPDEYERNLQAWVETLRPASPGEAEIVARVADVNFRLRRLQRLEDKHLIACIDAELKNSKAARNLAIATNARVAIAAMVATAGDVKTPITGERAAALLSPIRAVLDMVEAAGLPVQPVMKMEAEYRKLAEETAASVVGVESFARLDTAGRDLQTVLDDRLADLQKEVDGERDRIADGLLLGDDKELKRFERHRVALSRTLDGELSRLKMLRELGQGASGSFVGPFLVELRLVGRHAGPSPLSEAR